MDTYDYIIVGAGSAGCVLANRLSSNPAVRVCLIEAGPKDRNPLIHIPFGVALLSNNKSINWNLNTDFEPNLNNRALYWPRGKTLGGSSSINAMCYIRGHKENYNQWANSGCDGWDWDSLLPYFRKAENNSRGISQLHGASGPQYVSDLKHINPLTLEFIEAGKAIGLAENPDFNGISQEGIGLYQVTHKDGSRCSTAKGYLNEEVKARDNLTILSDCSVEALIIDEQTVSHVKLNKDGKTLNLSANKEYLLSAGAIGSPELLLKSGIGDKQELEEQQLTCHHHLPAVGKNLMDHLDITIVCKQTRADSYGLSFRALMKHWHAPLNYWKNRSGMLASNIAEGGAFLKSNNNLDLPDLQMHFLPALLVDHGRKKLWGHGFTIHVCHLYPQSKGQITIENKNGKLISKIKANYLSERADLYPLINGFKLARKIAGNLPLKKASTEFIPGEDIKSDDEIEAYIRANAETLYHPVGTCKMGKSEDESAVVTPDLKVKGISNLRVIDASIMPNIIGGNTNAPTIMIAEKAADLITKTA